MDKDIRLKGQWELQCENAELKYEGEIEALAVDKQGSISLENERASQVQD